MTVQTDPFRRHPGLKDLVTPAKKSFFRDFDPANMDEKMVEPGAPTDLADTEGLATT